DLIAQVGNTDTSCPSFGAIPQTIIEKRNITGHCITSFIIYSISRSIQQAGADIAELYTDTYLIAQLTCISEINGVFIGVIGLYFIAIVIQQIYIAQAEIPDSAAYCLLLRKLMIS